MLGVMVRGESNAKHGLKGISTNGIKKGNGPRRFKIRKRGRSMDKPAQKRGLTGMFCEK